MYGIITKAVYTVHRLTHHSVLTHPINTSSDRYSCPEGQLGVLVFSGPMCYNGIVPANMPLLLCLASTCNMCVWSSSQSIGIYDE